MSLRDGELRVIYLVVYPFVFSPLYKGFFAYCKTLVRVYNGIWPPGNTVAYILTGTSLLVNSQRLLSTLSFHVPQHTMQLIFGGQIVDSGCWVILDFDSCTVSDRHTGVVLGAGPRCHNSQGLWELDWLHFPSVATAAGLSTSVALSTSSF